MAHFYIRLLLIFALACALSACGTATRAERSTTASVATALKQQPAPSCRRYGLCRGMFGLTQPHPGDDIAQWETDEQILAR